MNKPWAWRSSANRIAPRLCRFVTPGNPDSNLPGTALGPRALPERHTTPRKSPAGIGDRAGLRGCDCSGSGVWPQQATRCPCRTTDKLRARGSWPPKATSMSRRAKDVSAARDVIDIQFGYRLTSTESRLALGNTVRHAQVRSGTEFSAMFGQKHF
jgi:hypothetical protein